MLHFECECGNKTSFFATGDIDERGIESLDMEDDDAVSYIISEDRITLKCKFCGKRYELKKYDNL
ncbi:hypothetical protein [Paenibacillus endoradicis]|uniref:Uncharacterized protein n=1 Tax=Candidatus Pristimantibacillus lignocellulolyticus TaxID=2994561 RepID=A0A9J6ZD75_9BACL|nr:hypothetical protein [Paenibacillus endoradicis]MCR8660671.1 hypothetical protein [Paenibacillus endoradicis]URN93991.1 MAG: hypothetical protein NAG76_19540 [Candidatus Pristimantibacillus lignocellulolyticus]